jgi:hypothetical protein
MEAMILHAFIISAIVCFIFVCFNWEGMIFEQVGAWMEVKIPEKLFKPLIGCPICMSPWWGIAIMAIFYWTGVWPVPHPVEIIATQFIAGFWSTLFVIAGKFMEVMKLRSEQIQDEQLPDYNDHVDDQMDDDELAEMFGRMLVAYNEKFAKDGRQFNQ